MATPFTTHVSSPLHMQHAHYVTTTTIASPARMSSRAAIVASTSLTNPKQQQQQQQQQSLRLRIPVSILLNPTESDAPPAPCTFEPLPSPVTSDASAMALVVLPQPPKRRGRRPILPKMNNSERGKYYRTKRKRDSETLADTVQELRDDVDRLRQLQSICSDLSLGMRMSLSGSLAQVVRAYFRQFRYGVQLPPVQRNMALPDVQVSTVTQELFMYATMAPDVGFGEFSGIATVMDQWTRYSQYHALLEFELLSIDISGPAGAPILSTTGQLRTRYSRKTIEHVFPHVVGDEQLTQRLIGREVVYPCRNQFYFGADGRVERYDVEADFVVALVSALGSSHDAARLLGQALIQQQHMMGEIEELSSSSESCKSWSPQLEVEYLLDDTDGGMSASTMA